MDYNLDNLVEEHAAFFRSILDPGVADEIREHAYEANVLPQAQKLGLTGLSSPKIALGDHLAAEAAPPPTLHRGLFAGYSNVLANDTLGDCGPAMCIHGDQGMNHAAGNVIPPFVAQDAIVFYGEEGGYVPGNASTDQGSDNAVMMPKWEKPGILCAATKKRHTIVGTVFVDPTNQVQNRVAIVEFGVVFRAMNLPITAQGQKTWTVLGDGKTGNSAPGSWGGHDIPGMAYDEDSIDWDSWGMWLPGTTEFDKAYAMQGIAVVTREMLNRKGVSPTGLNWTSLSAAFAKLVPGGDAS